MLHYDFTIHILKSKFVYYNVKILKEKRKESLIYTQLCFHGYAIQSKSQIVNL